MPRHSKSTSDNKVEEILRSTLRVLCSNAVSYGCQISIDAMVGITVDSSEVILVNIHEQVYKSGDSSAIDSYESQQAVKLEQVETDPYLQQGQFTATAADSSQYAVSDNVTDAAVGFDSSSQAFGDGDDGFGYDGSHDIEEGQYMDSFQDDETDEYAEEYFGAGMIHGDGYGGDDMYSCDVKPFSMPEPHIGGYHVQKKVVMTVSSARGRKSQSAAGRGSHFKRGRPGGPTKATVKHETVGETVPSSQGISTNEKTTVYTCSVCGKMIRHLTSFQRHKQQHEGIVFRCDLCGVVRSRRDTLNAHRRQCEAKMMQGSASQPFGSM